MYEKLQPLRCLYKAFYGGFALCPTLRAIREVFLAHFPKANPFLDGLVKAKYGNARYHILKILDLLEEYPKSIIEAAIDRATFYGAFECSTIRNICRQGEVPQPIQKQIELTEKKSLTFDPVQERSLSCYSRLEG